MCFLKNLIGHDQFMEILVSANTQWTTNIQGCPAYSSKISIQIAYRTKHLLH